MPDEAERDPFNPLTAMEAALRYAEARYGPLKLPPPSTGLMSTIEQTYLRWTKPDDA